MDENTSSFAFSNTISGSSSVRGKQYIQFVVRMHKSELRIDNEDSLSLRSFHRLEEICKCILRENFMRKELMPRSIYNIRFKYQHFLPQWNNFIEISNQQQY